ncbi:MAG: hypothetical protein LQ342_008053 [Letrouitia transgressa]|nr:MAG: hypothetical protein LQ342_008053 [Letrouitia transgressa]
MANYYYHPLPPEQIQFKTPPYTRLLVLSAGREPQPLHGVLELTNVESPPPFEALSYTWGSNFVDTPLYSVNGNLPIRANLDAALRSLRLPSQARRLWVDAICINQEDIQERTRQVQYMRLIYKRATRVIVWLGLKSHGIEEAFTLAIQLSECRRGKGAMKELDSRPEDNPTSSTILSSAIDGFATHVNQLNSESVHNSWEAQLMTVSNEESHESMALYLLKENPHIADLLRDLLKRPYFSRIWCIQEVLVSSWSLAKCEDLEIDFMDLIACAQYLHFTRNSVFGQILHFWDFVYSARTGEHKLGKVDGSMNSLLYCLAASRNFDASDPRDKVFTLLGISDEGLKPLLALWPDSRFELPDRTKRDLETAKETMSRLSALLDREYSHPALIADYSKDLVGVYRDLTRFFVGLAPHILEILSYVSHLDDPSEGSFPSWVPKWFQKQSTSPLMVGCYNAGLIFGPTRHSPRSLDNALLGKPQNPDILQLDGFRIDRVYKVSDTMLHDTLEPVKIHNIWSQLFQLPYNHSEVKYRSDESLHLAFLLTLTAGILSVIQHLLLHKGITRLNKDIPQVYEQAKMLACAYMKVEIEDSDTHEAALNLEYTMTSQNTNARNSYSQKQAKAPSTIDIALSQDWQNGVKAFSHNRRVYLTQNGYLGLGPKMMREGDEICVLYGGYVPFVLRPQGNHHILVGDTYVHDTDIMWGKFADAVNTNRSNIKNGQFILK